MANNLDFSTFCNNIASCLNLSVCPSGYPDRKTTYRATKERKYDFRVDFSDLSLNGNILYLAELLTDTGKYLGSVAFYSNYSKTESNIYEYLNNNYNDSDFYDHLVTRKKCASICEVLRNEVFKLFNIKL